MAQEIITEGKSYDSESFAESFIDRCCEQDFETIGHFEQHSEGGFDYAFLLPGHMRRILSNIQENADTCGSLIIFLDYRHHSSTSAIKGSYNATICLPDHTCIEFCTMPTSANENNDGTEEFFTLLKTGITFDENTVVFSDQNFLFLNDMGDGCEWRLCSWHVKKNLASNGHGRDRELFAKICATSNRIRADAMWTKLSIGAQMYLNTRGIVQQKCCISSARTFSRGMTAASPGEASNAGARKLRGLPLTKYLEQWLDKNMKRISKRQEEVSSFQFEDFDEPLPIFNEFVGNALVKATRECENTEWFPASSTQTHWAFKVTALSTSFVVKIPKTWEFEGITCTCGTPQVPELICGTFVSLWSYC